MKAHAVKVNTPLTLSDLRVTDLDGNLSTVQLTVMNGTVAVTLSGAASISAGANGTNTLTLAGSEADINATLASLIYQGALNYIGPDTLIITSTDTKGATDADTVAIAVTKAVADFHVATTGNDSNPGTQNMPWRTIQHAADVVNPGDVIAVHGGIYTESVHLIRGGTVGNPITFEAYPGETPIMDGTTLGGPVAGFWVDEAPNVIIDGFTITNYSAPGLTSGAVLLDSNASDTSATIVRNNTLMNFTTADNPAGVLIQRYRGTIEISNNVIHDNAGSAFAGNNTCVVIFMDVAGPVTSAIWIHNNECYNEGVGFKYKHPPDPGSTATFLVEKNIVRDIYHRAAMDVDNVSGAIVRSNIIYNVTNAGAESAGIWIGAENPALTSNAEVYYNTVFNVLWGVHVRIGTTGTRIHDNIFYGVAGRSLGDEVGLFLNQTMNPGQFDYNDYAGEFINSVACWGGYANACDNPANVDTLTQFRMRGFEAHGINEDPLFVAATGSPRDFHLQAGSPARGRGTNGLDMGAYPNGNEVVGPVP
ncbi:MAG: DUF1565 domain-containing protein [Nitrospiraceae bacterium]